MSKIQLNKNQKEVLFIVALFLVPFLDPGFALLLGLILSLTIGHPFLAINSRITHILLQISVVGLGFGMNVEQAIEAGKTGILFTIFHCRYHRFGIVLYQQTKSQPGHRIPRFRGNRHLWGKCHCRLGSCH